MIKRVLSEGKVDVDFRTSVSIRDDARSFTFTVVAWKHIAAMYAPAKFPISSQICEQLTPKNWEAAPRSHPTSDVICINYCIPECALKRNYIRCYGKHCLLSRAQPHGKSEAHVYASLAKNNPTMRIVGFNLYRRASYVWSCRFEMKPSPLKWTTDESTLVCFCMMCVTNVFWSRLVH